MLYWRPRVCVSFLTRLKPSLGLAVTVVSLTWPIQHCYRAFINRAEFWNPRTLGYRFLAEAKRHWELEHDNCELHTIQAGMILNHICNMSGADKIGWRYTIQAVQLAHKIELFTPAVDGQSDKLCAARAFTAWALFSWQRQVLKSTPGFQAQVRTRKRRPNIKPACRVSSSRTNP